MSFEPILLAPEEQPEEIYPYRRVWRTSWLEMSLLFFATAILYVLSEFLAVLPAGLQGPLFKVGFALLPLGAWFAFSYWGERRAPQPRTGLIGVLILGGLVANGIAIPLEEHLFLPGRWLPGSGFFGRVLGYMFTIGFTAEFLKYAVLRYAVWPRRFQQRLDGIAYALAVSLGYATAYNLRAALFTDATLAATALRVASVTFSQLGVGVIMGFFLAELNIGRTPVFWLPAGLGLASFVSGLYYAFRGIAIVSGLSTVGTASSPIRGLLLGFGLVVVVFVSLAFIVQSADTRMEALTGRREAL